MIVLPHNDQPHPPLDQDVEHEFIILAICIVGLGVLIAIAFAGSNPLLIVRTTLALAWLFLLPGYILTIAWRNHLKFAERIAIGVAIQAAVLAMLSYILSIAGWQVQTHGFILPAISILLGVVLEYMSNTAHSKPKQPKHAEDSE